MAFPMNVSAPQISIATARSTVLTISISSMRFLLARLVLIIFGGVVVLLPLALLESAAGLAWSQTVWGWPALALAVVAGVVPGAGSYLAYSTLQKKLGAATAGLTLYLAPLYGAAFAWIALNEPVQWHHATGAAIILPGIYLASRRAP